MVAGLRLAVGLVEWKVNQVQKTCCSAVNSTSHTHEYHSSATHVLKSALCGSLLMVCSLWGSTAQASPFFSQDSWLAAVGNTFSSTLGRTSFEQILHTSSFLADRIGLSLVSLSDEQVLIAANATNVAQGNLQNEPTTFSEAAIHALSKNDDLVEKDDLGQNNKPVSLANSAYKSTEATNQSVKNGDTTVDPAVNSSSSAATNAINSTTTNASNDTITNSTNSTETNSNKQSASNFSTTPNLSNTLVTHDDRGVNGKHPSATSSRDKVEQSGANSGKVDNASSQENTPSSQSDGTALNDNAADADTLNNNAADATAQLSQVKNPSLVLEGAGQNKFGGVRQSSGGALQNGLNTPAGILQWMLSTIGVLAFIFFLAYIFRKSRFVQRAVGTMQIEGQIALGPKERLVRVKVGERTLLLGVTSNNVNLILDISEPQLNLDNDTKAGQDDTVEDDFSSAYRSAQAAYARKNYEDMLANCSQIAASAAASAVVSVLNGKAQTTDSIKTDERLSQRASGQLNVERQTQGTADSQYSENSLQSKSNTAYGQDALQTNNFGQTKDSLISKEGQTTDTLEQSTVRLSNQDNLGGNAQSLMASSDSSTISSSRPSNHDAAAAAYEPKKFQAIVEPHANEAHNIANHFSSEHTIVRASKSTQFASTHFNVPPDNQVLHARAKRSKFNTRALELEVEPQSRTRPRSGQIDNNGKHQTKNSAENARFGAYLDSAFDELSKGQLSSSREGAMDSSVKSMSFMGESQPWIAEDDLAQAVEQQRKHHKR